MATSRQVKQVAVTRKNGSIDRTATIRAILAKFGPQDDRALTENIGRVDKTATLRNVQWALYALRGKNLAVKSDDIWAVS